MKADFETEPGDEHLGIAMLSNSLDGAGGTAGGGIVARDRGSAPDPLNRAKALDVIARVTKRWAL